MIDIITLSKTGLTVARHLQKALVPSVIHLHADVGTSEDVQRFSRTADFVERIFSATGGIVFIGPCGIMVRALAPLIKSKLSDPPIVVVDVMGRYAVSLLSGHEGGANDLTLRVANIIGAEPVITTTSDAEKDLIVGVGCRKDAPVESIVEAIRFALETAQVSIDDVRLLASADIKAEEPGLLEASKQLGIPLRLIASDEIRACTREFAPTPLAQEKVNLPAVAEPVALLAGRRTVLIQTRINRNGVTVAIARESSL
jgi:cobalt-precorrin 5A hydrolase